MQVLNFKNYKLKKNSSNELLCCFNASTMQVNWFHCNASTIAGFALVVYIFFSHPRAINKVQLVFKHPGGLLLNGFEPNSFYHRKLYHYQELATLYVVVRIAPFIHKNFFLDLQCIFF